MTDSPLIWRSASTSSAAEASAGEHRHPAATSNPTEREGGERWNSQGGGVNEARLRFYKRDKRKRSPFSYYPPGRSRNAPPSWDAQPREAAALLSLLFSWAKCGGGDGGDDGTGERARHSTAQAKRGAPKAANETKSRDGVIGSKAHDAQASSSSLSAVRAAANEGRTLGRSFTIVCPATRVRMNIETYVKDSDTGRVAVQWCLASKDTGENDGFGVCVTENWHFGVRSACVVCQRSYQSQVFTTRFSSSRV